MSKPGFVSANHTGDETTTDDAFWYNSMRYRQPQTRKWQGYKATCEELCGRTKPCGNIYCSNHPMFSPTRGTRRGRRHIERNC